MKRIKLLKVGVLGLRTPSGEVNKELPIYKEVNTSGNLSTKEKRSVTKFSKKLVKEGIVNDQINNKINS